MPTDSIILALLHLQRQAISAVASPAGAGRLVRQCRGKARPIQAAPTWAIDGQETLYSLMGMLRLD